MSLIFLDFETYSPVDLKKHGAWKYTTDPDARVVLTGYAKDDEPVKVSPDELPEIAPNDKIIAFNAEFEYLVLTNILGLDVKPEQMVCVMAMASSVGLSTNLDSVAKILGMPVLKDTRGKQLIKKLITHGSLDDEEMQAFAEYCHDDVLVMRDVFYKIKEYDVYTNQELAVYQDTLKINVKGAPVSRNLIDISLKAKKKVEPIIKNRFKELTSKLIRAENLIPPDIKIIQDELDEKRELLAIKLEAEPDKRHAVLKNGIITRENKIEQWKKGITHTQNAKLRFLLGVETLQKGKYNGEGLTGLRLEIYNLFKDLNFSAVAKVDKANDLINDDDRIRGSLVYHGAHTGRWSSKGFQLQNLPRKTLASNDEGIREKIREIKTSPDPVKVWDLISAVPRHIIYSEEGLCIFDFKSIEMYTSFALAGINIGNKDVYIDFATNLFRKDYKDINKQERHIAKPIVLGCQYQMSWETLQKQARDSYGIHFTDEEAQQYVALFRRTYPEIVAYWHELENSARKAVIMNRKVGMFECRKNREVLVMTLPSGRKIGFMNPKIRGGKLSFTNKNNQIETLYGGKLYNYLNQGTGRDILAYAVSRFVDKVVSMVHDEVIVEGYKHYDNVKEEMEKVPDWMPNIYLEAEGERACYYGKF